MHHELGETRWQVPELANEAGRVEAGSECYPAEEGSRSQSSLTRSQSEQQPEA